MDGETTSKADQTLKLDMQGVWDKLSDKGGPDVCTNTQNIPIVLPKLIMQLWMRLVLN